MHSGKRQTPLPGQVTSDAFWEEAHYHPLPANKQTPVKTLLSAILRMWSVIC